jgi:peptide/nickel transport system substrate-binding protein
MATPLTWGALWYSTCATLMAFRDSAGSAGFSLRPEAAAGPPEIKNGGRTYVFTVRGGLRFSDGTRVTAVNFKYALERVLSPAMQSDAALLYSDLKSVSASGLRLRIELNKPAGNLPMRLALAYACPVPTDYQTDPSGVPLLVGSGPYYVADYQPHRRVVIERNPNYRGSRPHRLDRIVIDFVGTVVSDIGAVEAGQADAYGATPPFEIQERLARTYGINKDQLFRFRGTVDYFLALNTSRGIFRRNVALRKAVNFALDRAKIAEVGPGFAHSPLTTDQIIPRWVPGWRDHSIYPLARSNLIRAQRLAANNLRDGNAVLYVAQIPFLVDQASLIARQLGQIGLRVTVTPLDPRVLDIRAGKPGEPYDMVLTRYFLDYPDPTNVLVKLLGGVNARRPGGNTNLAYFARRKYDRLMAAADRRTGRARLRAFSELDASIMRNEGPLAPLYEGSEWLFVSTRVGCLKTHPVFRFDLAAICVR